LTDAEINQLSPARTEEAEPVGWSVLILAILSWAVTSGSRWIGTGKRIIEEEDYFYFFDRITGLTGYLI
jgi:hypothetical protein